jgi:integrase
MGRPPTPLGTWGAVHTFEVRSGVYRARARVRDQDGRPRLVSATGSTKAAAERALQQVLVNRVAPTGDLITADMRLTQLAHLWIEFLREEGRIERTTVNEYERVLRRVVLPQLGGIRIREATTGRLERFIVDVRSRSENRQRKAKVVLGAMLDMAVRHDAITVNPVRTTARLRRTKRQAQALTVKDLNAVRSAVRGWMNKDRPGPKPNIDMADIVELMLATGCRIGEILALRWQDVNLESEPPTLTVTGTIKSEPGRGTFRKPHPKSDASVRTVALPAFAVTVLRRRREDAALPNQAQAIFATRNGTWHQVSNIERRWREVRKDTGFEWVTSHTFRKTVATLISERVDSETASQQLGHSSSSITKEFYISKPAVTADVTHVLDELAEDDPGTVAE